MSKSIIRKRILSQRDALSAAEIRTLSAEIVARLIKTEAFGSATTVALYSATRSEVLSTEIFTAAMEAGKRVVYPRTVGTSLEFVSVPSLERLQSGRFGVAEPQSGEVVPVREIDLMVLPGVAFDLQGLRLGYGLGCYDRVLAEHKGVVLVGLAYEFQMVESLPREAHDVPVHIVVTESRTLTI